MIRVTRGGRHHTLARSCAGNRGELTALQLERLKGPLNHGHENPPGYCRKFASGEHPLVLTLPHAVIFYLVDDTLLLMTHAVSASVAEGRHHLKKVFMLEVISDRNMCATVVPTITTGH